MAWIATAFAVTTRLGRETWPLETNRRLHRNGGDDGS